MSRVTPEFVAGLTVGEGYFGISVRTYRAGYRGGINMLPAASIGMNDVDTITAVSDYLKELEMPHWVFNSKTRRYAQINIHGLRRLNKYLPWILPHLMGDKEKPAANLYEYVTYRLALKPRAPVTDRDIEFVRRSRELNNGGGQVTDRRSRQTDQNPQRPHVGADARAPCKIWSGLT